MFPRANGNSFSGPGGAADQRNGILLEGAVALPRCLGLFDVLPVQRAGNSM